MTRHDPAAVLGFVLIGAASAMFIHIQFRMRGAGYRWVIPTSHNAKDYGLLFGYLKVRAKHSWSPWPAYLVWPCLVAGLGLLIFGLIRPNS